MQTFLPYPNFRKSALSLDKKRCWKQVVETKQLICSLQAKNLPDDWVGSKSYQKQSYKNHPARLMWVGYEDLLKDYYNSFLDISINKHKIKTTMEYLKVDFHNDKPFWLGDDKFHRTHRARLIEKDENFYLPQFPNDKGFNNAQYWWPVLETKTYKII